MALVYFRSSLCNTIPNQPKFCTYMKTIIYPFSQIKSNHKCTKGGRGGVPKELTSDAAHPETRRVQNEDQVSPLLSIYLHHHPTRSTSVSTLLIRPIEGHTRWLSMIAPSQAGKRRIGGHQLPDKCRMSSCLMLSYFSCMPQHPIPFPLVVATWNLRTNAHRTKSNRSANDSNTGYLAQKNRMLKKKPVIYQQLLKSKLKSLKNIIQ